MFLDEIDKFHAVGWNHKINNNSFEPCGLLKTATSYQLLAIVFDSNDSLKAVVDQQQSWTPRTLLGEVRSLESFYNSCIDADAYLKMYLRGRVPMQT